MLTVLTAHTQLVTKGIVSSAKELWQHAALQELSSVMAMQPAQPTQVQLFVDLLPAVLLPVAILLSVMWIIMVMSLLTVLVLETFLLAAKENAFYVKETWQGVIPLEVNLSAEMLSAYLTAPEMSLPHFVELLQAVLLPVAIQLSAMWIIMAISLLSVLVLETFLLVVKENAFYVKETWQGVILLEVNLSAEMLSAYLAVQAM